MASVVEQYTREMHDRLGYWATWAPGLPLDLGACGPVEDGVFKPESSLKDFGISFETDSDTTPTDWQHVSDGPVEIEIQVKGEAERIPNFPAGKAGMNLKFGRANAVVFASKGAPEHRIADVAALKRELVSQAQSGHIAPDYGVVYRLVAADSTSVVISQSSDSEFTVSADADFRAGIVDLANGSLNLSVVRSRNLYTQFVAEEGATPLFQALRIKRGFWGPRIENLAIVTFEQDDPFEELSPQSVWDAENASS